LGASRKAGPKPAAPLGQQEVDAIIMQKKIITP